MRIQWLESPETSGYLSEPRKKAFLEQVSACGIALAENLDAPVLRVTVQVTATKALLIADSADPANGPQVHMVEIPRSTLFGPREQSSAPYLRKELLWQQEKPLQSALEWQDQSTQERFLFLLSGDQFLRVRFENGAWKIMDSTELPAANRRSRFNDGTFLNATPEGKLDLLLHGKLCEVSANGPVSIACTETNIGGKVVGLSSNCEEFRRNLIAGDGDYTQPDRIILTQLPRSGVAIAPDDKYSASIDVPGPVLDISFTENWKAAFAVVRNLSTGNYEVYRITAVCNN